MNKLAKFSKTQSITFFVFVIEMTLQILANDSSAMLGNFNGMGKYLRKIAVPEASKPEKVFTSEVLRLFEFHEGRFLLRDENLIPSLREFDEKLNLYQDDSTQLEVINEPIETEAAETKRTEESRLSSELTLFNLRTKEPLPLKERQALREKLSAFFKERAQRGIKSSEKISEYYKAINQLDEKYEGVISQTQENLHKIKKFIQTVEAHEIDPAQGEFIREAALHTLDLYFGKEAESSIENELALDVIEESGFDRESEKLLNFAEVMSLSWAARMDSSLTEEQIQKYKINFVITLARVICDKRNEGESLEVDFNIAEKKIRPCAPGELFTRIIRFLIQEKHPVLEKESSVSDCALNDQSDKSNDIDEDEWDIIDERF